MATSKDETGPVGKFENLADSAKEYLDMRLDAIKLQLVENLSLLFSRIVSVSLLIIFIGIALAFLASAFSWWIGDLLGSKAAGTVITGGIFLLLALILYFRRRKLFINSMVAMFSKMFFEPVDKISEEE
jgi:nitrate reductase gamma subunit